MINLASTKPSAGAPRFVNAARALIAAALLGMAMAAPADAAILAGFPSVTAAPVGFNWAYNPIVGGGSNVLIGDYFTIYDFGGSFVSAPVGWTLTTALLGQTPAGVVPTDDASRLNYTFTYSAGPTIPPNTGFGESFVLLSTVQNSMTGSFTGRDHAVSGALQSNISSVNIPTSAAVVPPAAVPAPGTLVQLSVGLGAMLVQLRNRRARAALARTVNVVA